MEPQLRRRTPRISVDHWPAKYTVADDPQSGWHECVLLDVSLLGMGAELFGPTSSALIGRRLSVEVDVGTESSISLRLAGVVRNVRPGEEGGTRAGIEFVGLSESDLSVLKLMEQLNIRW